MLAEALPLPSGDFLNGLSWVLNGTLLIILIFRKSEKREISPNPLKVVEGEQYVTRREYEADREWQKQTFGRIERLIGELKQEVTAHHDKDVAAVSARMTADFNEVWDRFQDHAGQTSHLAERVSAVEALTNSRRPAKP